MVVDSVQDIRSGQLVLQVRPGWLALSAVAVLGAYLVLIASWLYLVHGLSGRTMTFLAGARIWFISSLGQQLPGRVWGIIQMGAMSVDEGIDPVAAGAASIINTVVNIATGMAVALIAGAAMLAAYFGDRAWMAYALAIIAMLGILLLPVIIPAMLRFARQFRPTIPEVSVSARLILVSAIANAGAWFLYGAAFLFLSRGLVDPAAASVVKHTAAFTTSYIIGYLAIIVPAGVGFRETALQQILEGAGMATAAQATALSVISRLWLLIILVLPALIFLAYRRPRNEKDPAAG
jgi:hypothetical protein